MKLYTKSHKINDELPRMTDGDAFLNMHSERLNKQNSDWLQNYFNRRQAWVDLELFGKNMMKLPHVFSNRKR
jgi:hypothetical protein